MYRIPGGTVDEITRFTNEFCNFLNELKRTNQRIIESGIGDFNNNSLNIDTNNSFNYYFESIISYGFYPKITLPTR